MLYTKVLTRKRSAGVLADPKSEFDKNNEISSLFTNMDTEDTMDPRSLFGKYNHSIAALKVESIYIGATSIKLQVKLYQVQVKLLDAEIKPVISRQRPEAQGLVVASEDGDDDLEEGSLHDSDVEDVSEVKEIKIEEKPKKPKSNK